MKRDKAQEKKECLDSEIKAGLLLLNKGMASLRDMDYRMGLESVYVPFFLLSIAFERLIKSFLCLIFLDKEGNLIEMPFKYTRSAKGHDLVSLLNRLISVITREEFSTLILKSKIEINFLQKDKALKTIIKALSNFGIRARYYNLQFVLEDTKKYENPIITWDRVKEGMLFKTRSLDQLNKIPGDKIMIETHKDMINVLEKFISILVRLLTEASGARRSRLPLK